MDHDYLALKTLILVVVGSYFAYALYWFAKVIPHVVEISLRPEYYSPPTGLRFIDSHSVSIAYLMEYSGFLGLMVRVMGASYAVLSAFLILKTKTNFFSVARDKISKALLLDGFYFFSFIPAIYFLLGFSALPSVSNLLLSIGLLTQILLISPFLISLSLKVRKYEPGASTTSLIRLAGLASMNYVIAMWVTYVLKWVEMISVDPYLFSAFSFRILGFLNTIVTETLAVVFAVAGELRVLRKGGRYTAMRWWGLSSIFFSMHIILYVIYVASVGFSRVIVFGELWAIPLIGLGAYLVLKNPKIKGIS